MSAPVVDSAPHNGGRPAPAELPAHVRLPLLGNPCLICAYPARYVDHTGRVHHADTTGRDCHVAPPPEVAW